MHAPKFLLLRKKTHEKARLGSIFATPLPRGQIEGAGLAPLDFSCDLDTTAGNVEATRDIVAALVT